jgi:hypothetical protein
MVKFVFSDLTGSGGIGSWHPTVWNPVFAPSPLKETTRSKAPGARCDFDGGVCRERVERTGHGDAFLLYRAEYRVYQGWISPCAPPGRAEGVVEVGQVV